MGKKVKKIATSAATGLIPGKILGGLGGGSKTKDVVTGSVGLTAPGQAQFDFANSQLTNAFNAGFPQIGSVQVGPAAQAGLVQAGSANFAPAAGAFNSVDFGGINNAIGRVEGFSGTAAAKRSLNQLGAFKGTADAFRTLRSLEDFGKREQQFVTDARNSVLSFDEGFQSSVRPLLQEAADGKFLTEQAGNPFIRDLIDTAQRPVIENFNEEVLPGLLSTFAGTGGVGSTLRGAFTGQQARDLQRNLGDISTTIGFNVFESERNKQLAAQQAILGFEDQGLNRQLAARTTNLNAAQNSAQQLLSARTAASQQATNLSQQRLAALQGQASGQVQLSAQRLSALQSGLQGRLGVGNLQIARGQGLLGIATQQQGRLNLNAQLGQQRNIANAGFTNQRNLTNAQLAQQRNISNAGFQQNNISQLLDFQRNSSIAGQETRQRLKKPGLF